MNCAETFRLRGGLLFDEKIFCGYNRFIDYDNFMRLAHFSRSLDLQENDVFLDAGCGYGYFTLYAGRMTKYAVGLDVQYWLTAEAETIRNRLGLENVCFKHASLYHIPFADGYFDKVLCAEVLEHLVDPRKVLKELARVCSDVLVIQTPTLGFTKILSEKLLGSDATETRRTQTENIALGHVQYFTPHALNMLIRSSGFKIVKIVSAKLAPLHLFTNNKFLITLEHLVDSLGNYFPFNQVGTMTIAECKKTS